ncbi:hypothetical protein NDU88_002524, partial [Pleurodeles waltl]
KAAEDPSSASDQRAGAVLRPVGIAFFLPTSCLGIDLPRPVWPHAPLVPTALPRPLSIPVSWPLSLGTHTQLPFPASCGMVPVLPTLSAGLFSCRPCGTDMSRSKHNWAHLSSVSATMRRCSLILAS